MTVNQRTVIFYLFLKIDETEKYDMAGIILFGDTINMLNLTPTWKSIFPNSYVGVFVIRDVLNPTNHPELEKRKIELEEVLRSQFSSQDRTTLNNHPVLTITTNSLRKVIMCNCNLSRFFGKGNLFRVCLHWFSLCLWQR